MRTARDTALASFIGSRVASRPLVVCMMAHLEAAELGDARVLLEAYDARTAQAIDMLASELPPEATREIHDIVADGVGDAAKAWRRAMGENGPQGRPHVDQFLNHQIHVRQSGSVSAGLVPDAGAEDDMHPDYGGRPRGSKVQCKLPKLIDWCTREGLRAQHEQAGSPLNCERLGDLAHPYARCADRSSTTTRSTSKQYVYGSVLAARMMLRHVAYVAVLSSMLLVGTPLAARSARQRLVTMRCAIVFISLLLKQTLPRRWSHRISSHHNQGHALPTCLLPQPFQVAWLPLMWESCTLRPIPERMLRTRCSNASVKNARPSAPSWSSRAYGTNLSCGPLMGVRTRRLLLQCIAKKVTRRRG